MGEGRNVHPKPGESLSYLLSIVPPPNRSSRKPFRNPHQPSATRDSENSLLLPSTARFIQRWLSSARVSGIESSILDPVCYRDISLSLNTRSLFIFITSHHYIVIEDNWKNLFYLFNLHYHFWFRMINFCLE